MQRELITEFQGLTLRLEFDYSPEDPMTRDYPGAPAQVEITRLWVEVPEDLSSMFEEELEERCWEDIRDMQMAQAEALAEDYYESKKEAALWKEEQEAKWRKR